MEMSESSLKRLRKLRGHVQRSLEVIRANEPFRLPDGQKKPEWNDLKEVVDVLCCRQPKRYAYMWAVAGALEGTMEAFTGRESLPDVHHVRRYLSGVLGKTKGEYEFEHRANTLFLLGRFRTKLTNRIAVAQKALQKKKKV